MVSNQAGKSFGLALTEGWKRVKMIHGNRTWVSGGLYK